MVVAVGFGLVAAGSAYWGLNLPRTPEELFRVRCSSCHELRISRLCEFDRNLRPGIVQVMRSEHGADEVISEREAILIRYYLKETFRCP